MIVNVNGKENLVQCLKNSDQIDELRSVFSEASSGSLTWNQYYYNTTYGALQVKSDSSHKGALTIKVGYVTKGTKIKVKAEIYSLNGVMPKITVDYHTIAQCKKNYWKGSSDTYQMNERGKFVPIELDITNDYEGYAKVVIGLFTADSGEYYVRNVIVDSTGCQIKRSFRVYNINQNTVVGGFGFDTANIEVDNSQKFMKITHHRPFSVDKRGIAFANVDAGSGQKNIVPRTRSQYNDHVIVEFYDLDAKDIVAPSTLSQWYYFSLFHFGFDYEDNEF